MDKETENNLSIESESSENSSKIEDSLKLSGFAFTIDFDDDKKVDTSRHKALVEKYKNRHKRGKSLSKLEDTGSGGNQNEKKSPSVSSSGRKSSIQSEGYYSSDERGEKRPKSKLTLPLKNVLNDNKMTRSFPNVKFNLSTIHSPDLELKDVSSPELDLVSPFSPKVQLDQSNNLAKISSPNERFVCGTEFDFDKSDSVSDAGTYTLENDNYSEEQKARMSIDNDFNIEQVSVMKKTEEYIINLAKMARPSSLEVDKITVKSPDIATSPTASSFASNQSYKTFVYKNTNEAKDSKLKLSPIMSPTQNLSITENKKDEYGDGDGDADADEEEDLNKTFTKVMFANPKPKTGSVNVKSEDQGCFTSITSSGAFSRKGESTTCQRHFRHPSLTKSEIHVETYTSTNSQGNLGGGDSVMRATINRNDSQTDFGILNATLTLGKVINNNNNNNLPPAVGGKTSPSKIPSPIHSLKPRTRNSLSSINADLSDSSLETESYLKPTKSIIDSLQKKLSLDSDQSQDDSDFDTNKKCKFTLNNNNLLKQKSKHTRHNSYDDRNLTISNKLEHFQNKNFQQNIDQTTFGHKVHNAHSNNASSTLRRSSSFTNKNNNKVSAKVSNLTKDINVQNSPSLPAKIQSSIHRSVSTVNIRPNHLQGRRVSGDHEKIDRSQYGDTESSSEEDFQKNLSKKKDLTNTRYNRAFSLRRARLDSEPSPSPIEQRCPNTPEMRRKFTSNDFARNERAISVDRRPMKTNDVQSRYLQNIGRSKCVVSQAPPQTKNDVAKSVPKYQSVVKPQAIARTDSGRFSMRATNAPSSATSSQKKQRKDPNKKQSGGRCNSTLSSREVDFQNWKRRKSYDPMKAAAEGKKKAEIAKKQQAQNLMVQSYTESNQDCDSSPSHSSSVHRSQSFHGTATLEQLISSEDEDLTLSADEGFSPPTPSPCQLSPARTILRDAWKENFSTR